VPNEDIGSKTSCIPARSSQYSPAPSAQLSAAHPLNALVGLIGGSPVMQRLYALIRAVALRKCAVLLIGESGTGKEIVANAIHELGPRRLRPFVPIDCGCFVASLVESELFGHVKGAFTGADAFRPGLLRGANGGTAFFDEIGELPLALQPKLLRALQERAVRPLGATEYSAVDIRIIAATSRNLEAAIREGAFREDLYFRLNVAEIKLPPLRERMEDIPLLANHFLKLFGDPQHSTPTISADAMGALMSYDWPGNVREFANAIEHGLALGSGEQIEEADLPESLSHCSAHSPLGVDQVIRLKQLERLAIARAMEQAGGNKLTAACLLGIGKTTLYRRLKKLDGLRTV
jgi:transcriptional regulator with PAS, ATPase and Fis domain